MTASEAIGGDAGRHLALIGPTASGKSAIALELARHHGDLEIVSVDSMQVYCGMDIGTAKPTPAEQAEVPHHLLDLVDPDEEFTVARWQRAARQAIADIESRGHRALLVGGTGLYFQALVDNLEIPSRWPAVRAELEAEAAAGGGDALHRRLVEVDPLAASRTDPANTRRVVRALEVTLGGGRPFSSYGPGLGAHPVTRFRLVGLEIDPHELGGRIERRLAAQLAAGFLDEVRVLSERRAGLSRTASKALGYHELLEHLAGRCSLVEAGELIALRTRQFARRQRAWFRRDPRIEWVAPEDAPGRLSARPCD